MVQLDGYSNGRLTINESQPLPSGTYFYILNYQYSKFLRDL
ncbi:hypothetical protein I215_13033 [Galbibacter marinus]|uniref:Uncharacterized protein n=1 Tax=Galbibacter marinus TaxID=555500 RepID=K2Q0G5_9FLAO|nr:hypothetical protein I215_13033 [Galbibacter marinus]